MFFFKKKDPFADVHATCPKCGYLKPSCFQRCDGCQFAPKNYDEAVLCMSLSRPHLTFKEIANASDNIRYGNAIQPPSDEFRREARNHLISSPVIQFLLKQNQAATG
jgi:hypothetical protein